MKYMVELDSEEIVASLRQGQELRLDGNGLTFKVTNRVGKMVVLEQIGSSGFNDSMPDVGFLAAGLANESIKRQLEAITRVVTQMEDDERIGKPVGGTTTFPHRMFGLQDLSLGSKKRILLKKDFFDQRIPYDEDNGHTSGDESQEQAVQSALDNPQITFIQGPPGTGKTVVIAEIARQAVRRGQRVMIVSQMHQAVDNVRDEIVKGPMGDRWPILRFGNHPDDFKYGMQRFWPGRVGRFKDRSVDPTRTDIKKEVINQFVSNRKKLATMWGVPKAGYIFAASDIGLDMDSYFRDLRLSSSEEYQKADLIIMDESSKETVSGAMVPFQYLESNGHAVLVGDGLQLPPTDLEDFEKEYLLSRGISEQAIKQFSMSIFDFLLKRYQGTTLRIPHGDRIQLSINRRSKRKITKLFSDLFYDGTLQSSDKSPADPDELILVDLGSSASPGQFFDDDQDSPTNRKSAEEVLKLIDFYHREKNLALSEITVVASYARQVELLRDLIAARYSDQKELPIVTTIDAYQGGENKAVIVDLVVSNKKQRIRFIKDMRRLNVALSRAQDYLAIIGDWRTIGGDPRRESPEDQWARRVFNYIRDYFNEHGSPRFSSPARPAPVVAPVIIPAPSVTVEPIDVPDVRPVREIILQNESELSQSFDHFFFRPLETATTLTAFRRALDKTKDARAAGYFWPLGAFANELLAGRDAVGSLDVYSAESLREFRQSGKTKPRDEPLFRAFLESWFQRWQGPVRIHLSPLLKAWSVDPKADLNDLQELWKAMPRSYMREELMTPILAWLDHQLAEAGTDVELLTIVESDSREKLAPLTQPQGDVPPMLDEKGLALIQARLETVFRVAVKQQLTQMESPYALLENLSGVYRGNHLRDGGTSWQRSIIEEEFLAWAGHYLTRVPLAVESRANVFTRTRKKIFLAAETITFGNEVMTHIKALVTTSRGALRTTLSASRAVPIQTSSLKPSLATDKSVVPVARWKLDAIRRALQDQGFFSNTEYEVIEPSLLRLYQTIMSDTARKPAEEIVKDVIVTVDKTTPEDSQVSAVWSVLKGLFKDGWSWSKDFRELSRLEVHLLHQKTAIGFAAVRERVRMELEDDFDRITIKGKVTIILGNPVYLDTLPDRFFVKDFSKCTFVTFEKSVLKQLISERINQIRKTQGTTFTSEELERLKSFESRVVIEQVDLNYFLSETQLNRFKEIVDKSDLSTLEEQLTRFYSEEVSRHGIEPPAFVTALPADHSFIMSFWGYSAFIELQLVAERRLERRAIESGGKTLDTPLIWSISGLHMAHFIQNDEKKVVTPNAMMAALSPFLGLRESALYDSLARRVSTDGRMGVHDSFGVVQWSSPSDLDDLGETAQMDCEDLRTLLSLQSRALATLWAGLAEKSSHPVTNIHGFIEMGADGIHPKRAIEDTTFIFSPYRKGVTDHLDSMINSLPESFSDLIRRGVGQYVHKTVEPSSRPASLVPSITQSLKEVLQLHVFQLSKEENEVESSLVEAMAEKSHQILASFYSTLKSVAVIIALPEDLLGVPQTLWMSKTISEVVVYSMDSDTSRQFLVAIAKHWLALGEEEHSERLNDRLRSGQIQFKTVTMPFFTKRFVQAVKHAITSAETFEDVDTYLIEVYQAFWSTAHSAFSFAATAEMSSKRFDLVLNNHAMPMVLQLFQMAIERMVFTYFGMPLHRLPAIIEHSVWPAYSPDLRLNKEPVLNPYMNAFFPLLTEAAYSHYIGFVSHLLKKNGVLLTGTRKALYFQPPNTKDEIKTTPTDKVSSPYFFWWAVIARLWRGVKSASASGIEQSSSHVMQVLSAPHRYHGFEFLVLTKSTLRTATNPKATIHLRQNA